MDFDDSAEEAAFRAEARAWLKAHAPELPSSRRRRLPTAEWLAQARAWQAAKAEAGYVAMAWPPGWGGRGLPVSRQIIFDEEEIAAGLHMPFFDITLGLCLPTLLAHADADTIARYAPPALRGEEIACQLFSEPGAGSDLAGVRTRAVREAPEDGGGWRIDGQKVWTSFGQVARWGLLVARTNVDVPKHRGLTVFWIDMEAPGVKVRPIRQMYGFSNYNEVFLDGVRVPDSARIGPVDGGWGVTLGTLSNERVSIGGAEGPDVPELVAAAEATPRDGGGSAADDPAVQAMVVDHHLRSAGVRLTRYRLMTAVARGEAPGPENAVGKLVGASNMQSVAHHGLTLQGAMGLLDAPELDPLDAALQESLLWSPGYRLAGGADEILKTILAERVLGLPPEPRDDRTTPFKDLPGPRA